MNDPSADRPAVRTEAWAEEEAGVEEKEVIGRLEVLLPMNQPLAAVAVVVFVHSPLPAVLLHSLQRLTVLPLASSTSSTEQSGKRTYFFHCEVILGSMVLPPSTSSLSAYRDIVCLAHESEEEE